MSQRGGQISALAAVALLAIVSTGRQRVTVRPIRSRPHPPFDHLAEIVRLDYPANSLLGIYPDAVLVTPRGYSVRTRDRGVVRLVAGWNGSLEFA